VTVWPKSTEVGETEAVVVVIPFVIVREVVAAFDEKLVAPPYTATTIWPLPTGAVAAVQLATPDESVASHRLDPSKRAKSTDPVGVPPVEVTCAVYVIVVPRGAEVGLTDGVTVVGAWDTVTGVVPDEPLKSMVAEKVPVTESEPTGALEAGQLPLPAVMGAVQRVIAPPAVVNTTEPAGDPPPGAVTDTVAE